jgi:hypothetical protein
VRLLGLQGYETSGAVNINYAIGRGINAQHGEQHVLWHDLCVSFGAYAAHRVRGCSVTSEMLGSDVGCIILVGLLLHTAAQHSRNHSGSCSFSTTSKLPPSHDSVSPENHILCA